MIATFSKLMEMIEAGTVPSWLLEEVLSHRAEIAAALQKSNCYTLRGPKGEEVEIRTEREPIAV